MDYDVIVAGHICLDIIPDMQKNTNKNYETMFRPGSMITMGPATLAIGGPVPNTGLAMHILDNKVRMVGKVGDDLFGNAVLDIIRSYGKNMADSMVVDKDVKTSYTFVISLPNLDRFFMHCPGANDTFKVDDVDFSQVEKVKLFHFGYPPIMRTMYEDNGGRLSEMYRKAKQTGVTTSLDLAVPDPEAASGKADWMRILDMVLPFVDIFQPSIEEILYMVRRDLFFSFLEKSQNGDILPFITPKILSEVSYLLMDMGAKTVAIKMGYRGLYLRTSDTRIIEMMGRAKPADPASWANKEYWAPVFKVAAVGTTGAGDSTIAGFLSAVLRGMSPDQALMAANAVGACNVEAADSLGGLRSWDATMQRVAEGWERGELVLDAPDWRYDPEMQLWIGPASR
ncbi:MAG: carbohydrate kinase family protein [Chloroflexota bacterium]